jgi:bile acid:Na+ symporter, BASS family
VADVIKVVATFLVHNLVVFLCLALGLGLRPGALRASVKRQSFWRGVAVAMLGAPLLTMLIVWLLPLDSVTESVILLSAVAPGVPFLVATVKRQGGDVELAAALSVALTAVAVSLLPLSLEVVGRVTGVDYDANLASIARAVVLPTFVALAVGLAIRRLWPGLAERLFPWIVRLFKVALAVAVIVLVVPAIRALASAGWVAGLAGLLIPLLLAAFGHFLGGPALPERKTIAIVAVFGNPAVALAVTATTLHDRRALPVLAAFLILRGVAMLVYGRVVHRVRMYPYRRRGFRRSPRQSINT